MKESGPPLSSSLLEWRERERPIYERHIHEGNTQPRDSTDDDGGGKDMVPSGAVGSKGHTTFGHNKNRSECTSMISNVGGVEGSGQLFFCPPPLRVIHFFSSTRTRSTLPVD